MAITGVLIVLFVIGHMVGNLQMFTGQDAINHYAAFLKSMPKLLWVVRLGMLGLIGLHVVTAFQLRRLNADARKTRYVHESTVQASASSRYMILSGTLLLMYIIGHLLHFTVGTILPQFHTLVDGQGRPDVFSMVVLSFKLPIVSGLYIFAMLMLWSHLSHGISSVFQSLGLRGARCEAVLDRVGPALSTVIILGYISIPIAVLLGIITLPAGVNL